MFKLKYLFAGIAAVSAGFSSYAAVTSLEKEDSKAVADSPLLITESQKVSLSLAPHLLFSIAQDYELSQVSTGKVELPSNIVYSSELDIDAPINTLNLLSDKPQSSLSANSLRALTEVTEAIADEAITPLCPTLSTGTLYDANGASTGGEYCYHFNVPSRSKANVFVTNITEGSDMSLTLFKHGPDDSLIVVGQSNNTGNNPELITALTEPGDYYWYIQAVEADNASFSFAATLNTDADAYELNETPSQATVLPDKVNNIIANIDSASDYDYYSFEVHGQELLFYLTQDSSEAPSDQWLLDYHDGNTWRRVNSGGGAAPILDSGTTLYLRVYHNPDQDVHPEYDYRLNVGSRVAEMDWHNVDGDANLSIPYGAVPDSVYQVVRRDEARNLVTQTHDDITWSVRLLDSTGAPIEGATAVLAYSMINKGATAWSSDADVTVTDANGIARGDISLGSCASNFTSEVFDDYDIGGGRSWWQSSFNFGLWYIYATNSREGVGVGSRDGRRVSIGHICRHRFIRSER